MTDKGVPKKLWIAPWWWETKLQNAVRRKNEDMDDDVLYIRKDLADELARLVEMAMRGKFLSEDGADALARYHAETEGK